MLRYFYLGCCHALTAAFVLAALFLVYESIRHGLRPQPPVPSARAFVPEMPGEDEQP